MNVNKYITYLGKFYKNKYIIEDVFIFLIGTGKRVEKLGTIKE